ncbi:MAG TPA: sporulation integral membrane protein YlbJ [Firmicutes bacterium]|jgi:sporulation integral membrane protein YlbJ|nr:sporulation integral membrane protein YlbJ [Bacillota bacterium]
MKVLIFPKLKVLAGAALVCLLTLSLVIYPKQGVDAAVAGLKVFWDIVLPSLLPFFVLSEIMLGMGIVHFIGVLLEPLMRPLFNVPGVGAFALSMGLAAGYPMDAVITGKFRKSGLCTKVEGERLLSFTNTADPLFIFGAVAVGMFGRPELGVVLALAHYIASFTVGIVFKFYRKEKHLPAEPASDIHQAGLMTRAVRALFKARREDGRPLGRLMGDAVKESMSTLLMIGGFIMLFSVIVKMLTVFGFLGILNPLLGGILKIFNIDPHMVHSVFYGILEIDLGTMAASKAAAPLLDKVMIASWIIAWSGLCVHGQVASVIHDTDIRMAPYFAARLLHGIFAAGYTWLLLGPVSPVFMPLAQGYSLGKVLNPLNRIIFSGKQLLIITGILLVCSLGIHYSRRYRIVFTKGNKSSAVQR